MYYTITHFLLQYILFVLGKGNHVRHFQISVKQYFTSANSALGLHLLLMSEFHSLSTLIKRLEVATTRLEDLALSGMSASTIAATNPPAAPSASSAQPKEAPLEVPRAVEAFNSTMDAPVKQFIELSGQLGGPVEEQVRIDKPVLTRQFLYTDVF